MTRIDNRINSKVDVLTSGNGSDVVIMQLRDLASAYQRVGYHIVALVDGLNECEGNTAEMKKAHQSEADKAEHAMAVQDMKVNQTITAFLKSRNARQDGAGDGHIAQLAGAFKPKVEALMPPILTEENTPAEYKVWKKKWDSYYQATGMHNSILSVQRTFLESFLNAHLVNLLGEEALDGTPVSAQDGQDSCIDILDKILMVKTAVLTFWTRSSTGSILLLFREPSSGPCVKSRASVSPRPWLYADV